MFHIILQDIKSILKKPFLILLLFFGLMVGAFSVVTVYTVNSSSKVISNAGFSKDRLIQCSSFYPEGEAEKMLDIVRSNYPDVEYISVLSYQFSGYDVVGIYNMRDDVDGNYYGEPITAEDMGQYMAMISEDFFEAVPANGEEFKFSGKTFILKGTFYGGDAGYDAVGFDLRRLPEGTEYVAGMDFSLERDESISARNNKAILMPYDVFTELQYEPSVYVLFFSEPLTEEMRTEIQADITEATGIEDFLNLGDFDAVLSKTQWSSSVLYFGAVIAGLINIVALYAFIIEQNKKTYHCYRLLGAKNRTLIFLISAEIFIVTLIAYIAGAFLSAVFMKNAEMTANYVLPDFVESVILFLLIYLAELGIGMGKIRNILGIAPKRKQKAVFRGEQIRSKFFYLLRCQYGSKSAAGVFSVVLLSFLVSSVFSYAMTYLFEQSAYERYVKANTLCEVITVNPSDAHYEKYFQYFGKTPYTQNPEYLDFYDKLNAIKGTTIGIQHEKIDIRNENYRILPFNGEYLKNIRIPLEKGSQQKLLQYDASDETAPIPCLVSGDFAREHPVGSVFTKNVTFYTEHHILSEEEGSGQYEWEEPERSFEVAGVYTEDAMVTNGEKFFNAAYADIAMYLTPVDENTIITPEFLHKGKLCYETEEPTFFLFAEKGNERLLIGAKEALAGAADLHSFSSCVEAYAESYRSGGNLFFVYGIIGALLLLLGTGTFLMIQFASNLRTFGIYFTCGMPWRTAVILSMVVSAVNMLPSSLLGGVLGIAMAVRIRGEFFRDTLFLSFAAGFALVVLIYIIVSAGSIFMIRGKHPRRIFEEVRE